MDSGGGGGGCGSGNDQHISDSQRKKSRYNRHTPHQIQQLEMIFKECPHPDEKKRMQLSKDLGLQPRQIKFWFQNRRTQMKAQHERTDNFALRSENDKIRCENIAIREALKNVICPNCGGPPVVENDYYDEQKLRFENAQLKEELNRISSYAAKYIGRPISRFNPAPIASTLDLTVGSYGSHGVGSPTINFDLVPGSSSSCIPMLHPMGISEMERSLMVEVAHYAMEELIKLFQTGEPLWIKSAIDGREILDIDTYERLLPRPINSKRPNVRTEGSRESGVVNMDALTLVDIFIDSSKWMELLPTIVSDCKTIEILSSGTGASRSGSLQLMYSAMHALTALIPTREFYLLRYCQEIEQGLWVIADVSFDFSRESQFVSPSLSRKLPSGCLIQDLPNGYSKVSWIEHLEVEEKAPTPRLYRDLVHRGVAFGAGRWITTLQRMCERMACLLVADSSTKDPGKVLPSPEGKRSLMMLAQRMINNFCASISARNTTWTTLSGLNDNGVRVSVHKSTGPGAPSGAILSATASIWLPISPQNAFNFFKDEKTRPQWDVLCSGNSVQEVANLANASDPGNCISVLRYVNASDNNTLILQECCTDLFGSLIIHAPVDIPSLNLAMSGEDPSFIPLLPSGFVICPDGRSNEGGASTSLNVQGSGGSLLTIAFQIHVSSLPSAKLNLESVSTINNLITTSINHIKTALNCPGS